MKIFARFMFGLCLVGLMAMSPGFADRPQCGSTPGTCFFEFDGVRIGFFFEPSSTEVLGVNIDGTVEDFTKIRPDGTFVASVSANDADIFYCPAGVTGADCSGGFPFPPGPLAWLGTGHAFVHTVVVGGTFTCPETLLISGSVTDPATSVTYNIVGREVKVPEAGGGCKTIQRDIELSLP